MRGVGLMPTLSVDLPTGTGSLLVLRFAVDDDLTVQPAFSPDCSRRRSVRVRG